METPERKKWIKLRFVNFLDAKAVEYEDGLGNVLKVDETTEFMGHGSIFPQIGSQASMHRIRLPKQIPDLIQQVIRVSPTERATRKGMAAVPVAAYIEIPDDGRYFWNWFLTYNVFESLFFDLLSESERNNLQVVQCISAENKGEIDLPLNIRSFRIFWMLWELEQTHWYTNTPELKEYGLNIDHAESFLFKGDFQKFNDDVDILILASHTAPDYLEKLKEGSRLPRFFILLGEEADIKPFLSIGIPFLLILHDNWQEGEAWLTEFFLNIIHDYPLHEALYERRNEKHADMRMQLFASPESNHNLRLTGALSKFQDNLSEYANSINPGDLQNFLDKLKKNTGREIFEKMDSTFKWIQSEDLSFGENKKINDFFQDTRFLGMHFQGESTGLIPLSKANKIFKMNKPVLDEYKARLQNLVNDKVFYNSIREIQERKVDITIDEFSDSLVYTPTYPTYPLYPSRHYRLNVCIGQLAANSLMSGEIPAIDPLLPDPKNEKGHELDVVVFAKDFILRSQPLQKLYLPLLGGSAPVHFEFETPATLGVAQMRIVVFHKNHLLQAFLMEASVEPAYGYGPGKVKVALDLSTSSRFTNIDELKERDIYFAMNSDTNGGHSFFIKSGSETLEVNGLNISIITSAQDNFVKLLQDGYFKKDGSPQFSSRWEPGEPLAPAFKEQIELMAKFGRQYYKLISEASVDTPLEQKFREVKQSKNCKIQIGRHDINLSFPWNIVYDVKMPPPTASLGKYPVCMGRPFTTEELAGYNLSRGKNIGCQHNPDIHTYCVEGFWGVRHQVEQIIKRDEAKDNHKPVVCSAEKEIIYAYNIVDEFTTALNNELPTLHKGITIFNESQFLMDLLWNQETRPAALILLGHLETTPSDIEPSAPRILTFPKEKWTGSQPIPHGKWVYHDLLFEYYDEHKRWATDPLPIVFLINCSVAMLRADSLESIVRGFSTAGASAIVATDCDITTGMGTRFIREVVTSMFKDKRTLGEAIQLFNQRLMQSGIPLAFVFNCLGNMDLTLIEKN